MQHPHSLDETMHSGGSAVVTLRGPLPSDEVAALMVYKVIPATVGSITAYNQRCVLNRQSTPGSRSENDDWAALYLQTSVAHAESSLGYRWDADPSCKECVLARGRVRASTAVFAVEGPLMADGAVSGAEKAARLREVMVAVGRAVLNVDPHAAAQMEEVPLMALLPPQTALLIPEVASPGLHDETCCWMELVVPHEHVDGVIVDVDDKATMDEGTLPPPPVIRYARPRLL